MVQPPSSPVGPVQLPPPWSPSSCPCPLQSVSPTPIRESLCEPVLGHIPPLLRTLRGSHFTLSKTEVLTMALKSLHHLLSSPLNSLSYSAIPCFSVAKLISLLSQVSPFLPQGLCTCCSTCLECFSLRSFIAHFFPFFIFQPKSCLLGELSLDFLQVCVNFFLLYFV